jgi:predicted transcriptional regulator
MPRPPPRKRRAPHVIIMEILKVAKKGTKKTHIMYKAKLSFDMLDKYLNALKEADFITEESGIWRTTEKGFHVIKACEICQRFIKEVA